MRVPTVVAPVTVDRSECQSKEVQDVERDVAHKHLKSHVRAFDPS